MALELYQDISGMMLHSMRMCAASADESLTQPLDCTSHANDSEAHSPADPNNCALCFRALPPAEQAALAPKKVEELAQLPPALQLRWAQLFIFVSNAEFRSSVRDPCIAVIARLVGLVGTPWISVQASRALTRLLHARADADPELGPFVAERTEAVRSVVRALREGVTAVRGNALPLAQRLCLEPALVLSETLFSSGMLDACIEQLSIGPERFVEELKGERADQLSLFWDDRDSENLLPKPARPSALVRFAPRYTAFVHGQAAFTLHDACRCGATVGRMRARLAAHQRLVPVLLDLLERPCPDLYPESQSGPCAAKALAALAAAPVWPGSELPTPGEAEAPVRFAAPGSEGLAATAAAARAAHSAILAARSSRGDPAADCIASALRRLLDSEGEEEERSRLAPAARRVCISSGDRPSDEKIRAAIAERRDQAAELAWCLASLAAFPEHARSLRRLSDSLRPAVPASASPRFTDSGDVYTVLRGTLITFTPRFLHAIVAFFVRVSPGEGLEGLAQCSAGHLREKGNGHFREGNAELAAMYYGTALALCPRTDRAALAALWGNLAECCLSPPRPRPQDAALYARASLLHAESAGRAGSTLAEKAQQRLRRAEAAAASQQRT